MVEEVNNKYKARGGSQPVELLQITGAGNRVLEEIGLKKPAPDKSRMNLEPVSGQVKIGFIAILSGKFFGLSSTRRTTLPILMVR